MKQLQHFSCTIVVFFVSIRQILAVDDDFCKANNHTHYTGPDFTCCNYQKFPSPNTNPFKNREKVEACLSEEIKNEKLVKKTWLLYKCLIEKDAGGLSIDNFAAYMMGRFSQDIKDEIKKSIEEIKKHLPKKSRRKRNLRVKREDETDATTEKESQKESTPQTTEASTAGDATGNENEAGGASEATESNNGEKITSEDMVRTGSTEETPVTDKVTTEATPPEPEPEPEPEPKPTGRVVIPVYRYLSVYEYFNTFKKYIPDEELLQSWDIYYVAEFEACRKLAGQDSNTIKGFGTERCLSWLQRTARDGECCGPVPIPMPLFPHPLYTRDEVRNHTADHILSLVGKYIWDNITFSSNIDRCLRLSVAVMEGQITLEKLKGEIDDYDKRNASGQPDYREIADNLIPFYYSQSMKEEIKNTILPQNNPQCTPKSDQEKHFFEQLDCDSDLQKMQDLSTSIHQFAVASEWAKPHEIKARYLMWTCDAYRMIYQRIRYYNYEEKQDCY